eukprot:CAMPEP_0170762144 /NCGR_PEP_ID=MMETSP0733-20121128/2592_1 /TAXON_ID=186038 /ORGANISM="Fragilariopsis kerguelensis, Strain L26-C5" /LENGTH=579 /DNA_ID=CAMNT_0011102263 /DNA_START=58 /DNA_END=1794 /DNA_ORIENTATION=+
MASSSFESSMAVPTESTPFDLSFAGSTPQGKKKKSSSRSVFSQVVALFVLVGLCFTVYSRLSPLASSTSLVNQSISKSVNKDQNENENIVIPTASLVESKTKTSLQQVTKAATTTTTDFSVEATGKYILKFPPNVQQDVEKGNFDDIIPNCNKYLDENKERLGTTPSFIANILACQIYQIDIEPIVLGTLKTGVDVLEIVTDMDTIRPSQVSSLFVDYAFAAMIERGCFVWNNQDSRVEYTNTQYSGKTSYSKEYSSTTGLSVGASAGYAGVTVSAGYEQSNTISGGSEGTTETAYGQQKYSALVGELTNKCFSTQSKFDNGIKDLVKPEWVQRWTAIRQKGRYQTVEDLLNLEYPHYLSEVADGGFLMPMKYIYRVGTKSTLSTSYTTSSTIKATDVSKVITAGLSASVGGTGGSINTAISNAVNKSKKNSTFKGTVKQHSVGFGSNVDIDCFKNNNCATVITRSVKSIREDYTKLGSPSSLGREYKSLDDIVKLYFGERYGLPDNFLPAVIVSTSRYTQYNDKHCGGSGTGPLEDGTPAFFYPNRKGESIDTCKSKCVLSPKCVAFVWRDSDGSCNW